MVQLFAVAIYFVLMRETLEASVIVSVLIGLVEQIVKSPDKSLGSQTLVNSLTTEDKATTSDDATLVDTAALQKRLLRKMRIAVFAGAGVGLAIAIVIGAIFLAIYYTTLADLWGASEEIWEGTFSLIACLMIFVMGLAMLKMDRAKARWRVKLAAAFHERPESLDDGHHGGRSTKYTLFILPAITVLREGLEAVVFVGGVSLGLPASSIPIPAVTGLLTGLIIGFVIYFSSSRLNLSYFLVLSTSFLLLIGAGLASKAVGDYQRYAYNSLVGGDIAETGDGAGSFNVHGNVWHLLYGNPEDNNTGGGWLIFNALLGWTNNATIGTILSYCLYWIAVIVSLVYMKWKEGRVTFFGKESAMRKKRRLRREERCAAALEKNPKALTWEDKEVIATLDRQRPPLSREDTAEKGVSSANSDEIQADIEK